MGRSDRRATLNYESRYAMNVMKMSGSNHTMSDISDSPRIALGESLSPRKKVELLRGLEHLTFPKTGG